MTLTSKEAGERFAILWDEYVISSPKHLDSKARKFRVLLCDIVGDWKLRRKELE